MTDHAPFVVNVKAEGEQHVMHRFPAFEQCNLDDAAKLVYLDKVESDAMCESGAARRCEFCFGD